LPIVVTIAVHRSGRNHIREWTEADIRSVGVLGDKSISLVTPDYQAPLLEEGGSIKLSPKVVDVDKLLAQGTDMVADVTEITESLKKLLNTFNQEEGVLQSLIDDPQLALDLKSVVNRAVSDLQRDDTLIALLMRDQSFAAEMRGRIMRITEGIESLTSQYGEAQGLIPMLMADEDYKAEVKSKVDTLLREGITFAESLNEGKGLVHRLLQDEEYGERVAENIEKASYHLASILEKIDEGEGSASMVVNDPSLYEGLYEVVYGIKNSGISSWYIRRKQRQGERLLEKQKEESQ
jgi:phospholipid/cholesterol/gamma-HCH transport system substrate-binding protein